MIIFKPCLSTWLKDHFFLLRWLNTAFDSSVSFTRVYVKTVFGHLNSLELVVHQTVFYIWLCLTWKWQNTITQSCNCLIQVQWKMVSNSIIMAVHSDIKTHAKQLGCTICRFVTLIFRQKHVMHQVGMTNQIK